MFNQIVLCCLIVTATFANGAISDPDGSKKEPVKVKVTPSVTRTSDKFSRPHYNVQVTQKDKVMNLELKPIEKSIFSPNFKLHMANVDSAGNMALRDATPARKELLKWEKNLFVDESKLVVVRLERNIMGCKGVDDFRMNGVMEGHAISYEDGQHYSASATSTDKLGLNQYVDTGSSNKKFGRSHKDIAASAEPELSLMIQYENTLLFPGGINEMIGYYALLMHAVNTRYASIPTLNITFSLTGIIPFESPSAQPFINDCYQQTGGSSCNVVQGLNPLFTAWVDQGNHTLPKRDILVLVHQVTDATSGEGAAYIGGACQQTAPSATGGTTDLSIAVVKDSGGFFGVHTMTHELAHCLGAPHDGELTNGQDARSCSWQEGYIMSYAKYGGPNKFLFSRCSISLMTSYIASPVASCLQKTLDANHIPLPSNQGGDYDNLLTQCQKAFGATAVPYTYGRTDDEQCREVICLLPGTQLGGKCYGQRLARKRTYAAESTPCGPNGICSDSFCVRQPSLSAQCRKALKDPAAHVNFNVPANSLCANLSCSCIVNNGTNVVSLNKPAKQHSPCGFNGRCIDNVCREALQPPDMTTQCQMLLNDPTAYVMSTSVIFGYDDQCAYLTCVIPGVGTILNPLPPYDYTACGEQGKGNFCLHGKCVPVFQELNA